MVKRPNRAQTEARCCIAGSVWRFPVLFLYLGPYLVQMYAKPLIIVISASKKKSWALMSSEDFHIHTDISMLGRSSQGKSTNSLSVPLISFHTGLQIYICMYTHMKCKYNSYFDEVIPVLWNIIAPCSVNFVGQGDWRGQIQNRKEYMYASYVFIPNNAKEYT